LRADRHDGFISGCPTLDASRNEVYRAWNVRANIEPGGEPHPISPEHATGLGG
jgi:hypothetical protein